MSHRAKQRVLKLSSESRKGKLVTSAKPKRSGQQWNIDH